MSIYYDMKVSLSLGNLSAIYCAANCLEAATKKCDALEKRNAELLEEREAQTKEIGQLQERLKTTECDLKKWTEAAQAEKPIADANAFLDEHNTPFESNDVDTACDVIRALLAKKPAAPAKPANPFDNNEEDLS